MQIRLFTTWYMEAIERRRREYEHCKLRNLNCKWLGAVQVFDESGELENLQRLNVRRVSRRPTYADFFSWINELASPNDFSVIANTDICIDNSIRMLERIDWSGKVALAISRWDVAGDGRCSVFDRGDSQDCWIFRGPITGVEGNFPLGVYDCDNKIAYELQQAGYRVLNPALSLRTYHHHQCGYRSYEQKPAPDYGIRPPFLYVEPDNLWGPLRAWQIKRELNLPYLPWSMTWNRFFRYPIPGLVRRVWRKLTRTPNAYRN
ncbi:MAG: hypothetical protein RLZZ536_3180 [Planctomycetota bacterium]